MKEWIILVRCVMAALLFPSFAGCGAFSFSLVGQPCSAPPQRGGFCDAKHLWSAYCAGPSCVAAPTPMNWTPCEYGPVHDDYSQPSSPHDLEPRPESAPPSLHRVESEMQPVPLETIEPSETPAPEADIAPPTVSSADDDAPAQAAEPAPEQIEVENDSSTSPEAKEGAPPTSEVDENVEPSKDSSRRVVEDEPSEKASEQPPTTPTEKRESEAAPPIPINEVPSQAIPLNPLPETDPPTDSAQQPRIQLRWTSRVRTYGSWSLAPQ